MNSWAELKFWQTPTWNKVRNMVAEDEKVTPNRGLIFRPLVETPLDKVRVVFLNREPYTVSGRSDGLAFSCSKKIETMDELPVALHNLFTELVKDFKCKPPRNGNLRPWAKQGVLLWNSVLTGTAGKPFSHAYRGWEVLTREVLETVYLANPDTVFVLFDKKGLDEFERHIPKDANLIKVASPGASTAYDGFFGSHIYTRVNELLVRTKQKPIDWSL